MYILSKLSTLVIVTAMSLGIVSTPIQTAPLDLGAAVPQTPALYDGYLSSNIGTGDTSMTITPSTLRNGQTLSGYMCFVMDVNQPTVEYTCGTAVGSAITGLTRGVDLLNPTTTSATLAFSHRRFASVSVSDYPTIQLLVQKLNGADNLDVPLSYSFASTSLTKPSHLVDKDYVDGLAFQGASVINANTSSKGVVQISTGLQAASSTATGSTGAALVLPSSIATSTCNASGSLQVVVTQNNNTINPNCLPATFTTATTFSATSTLATTTILTYSPLLLLASSSISTANATVTVSSLPRSHSYTVVAHAEANGFTNTPSLSFNSDLSTGHYIDSVNGLDSKFILSGYYPLTAPTGTTTAKLEITNEPGYMKTITGTVLTNSSGSFASASSTGGTWNSTATINKIDMFIPLNSGTLGTGSFINVYGTPY